MLTALKLCRLLGPNGAGKSTSINMMIGFLEATAGVAFIDGKDIRTDMNDVYSVRDHVIALDHSVTVLLCVQVET